MVDSTQTNSVDTASPDNLISNETTDVDDDANKEIAEVNCRGELVDSGQVVDIAGSIYQAHVAKSVGSSSAYEAITAIANNCFEANTKLAELTAAKNAELAFNLAKLYTNVNMTETANKRKPSLSPDKKPDPKKR